jgi:hypothetical protein
MLYAFENLGQRPNNDRFKANSHHESKASSSHSLIDPDFMYGLQNNLHLSTEA